MPYGEVPAYTAISRNISRDDRSQRNAFKATDPARYAWGQYDALLAEAQHLGWPVLLTLTSPVPRWATSNRKAPFVTRPDAKAFEEFATGRFTKEQVLDKVTRLGLRTRTDLKLNPQSFGRMLTNRLYAGFIHAPEFGVSRRADFDPLISDETFYRVQAILQGRIKVVGPHQRVRPDFPLKSLVRCADCGRPSQSAFYRRRPTCGVQASLNQKQRLQQPFFPDGIAFDGKRFVRTAVTTHAFNYLTCADDSENQVASPPGFEPGFQP